MDPNTEDPKEDLITEETKKNFIMKYPKQDLKEDSITEAHKEDPITGNPKEDYSEEPITQDPINLIGLF